MSELSFPNPPLADEVVVLRAWKAEDVPTKVMGFADPSVQRFSRTKETPYMRVARLELTCGPDNGNSQRVAERCGFVREGVLRSHVPFKRGRRDTVMFSLLPDELR